MNSEQLRDLALKVLDDMKAIDVSTMDVRTLTTITDYMIICSARSTRHVKAIADAVSIKAKEEQLKFVHTEGDRESEWILVDLGDVIVHVMLPNTRSFYALEDLWEPVKELRSQQTNS